MPDIGDFQSLFQTGPGLCQPVRVEFVDIPDQFGNSACGGIKEPFPKLGTCCSSIAGDAIGVEVSHFPAERMRPIRTKMLETPGKIRLLRGKAPGLCHVDKIRPQRKHHRSLDLTAMNAEGLLFCRHKRRRNEPGPACGRTKHVGAHPQFRRNNRHQRRVAAMRIDDEQFGNTVALLPEATGRTRSAALGLLSSRAAWCW